MHKEGSNDTSGDNCQVLVRRILFAMGKNTLKKKIVRVNCLCLVYILFGFIAERLASIICIDRPSLAKALKRTSWFITEHSLLSLAKRAARYTYHP